MIYRDERRQVTAPIGDTAQNEAYAYHKES